MTLTRRTAQATDQLAQVDPWLARVLAWNQMYTPTRFTVSDISCETVLVAMRDGTVLATDLYLPPAPSVPTVAVRTPYDRAADELAKVCLGLARRGYAVVAQDCRGTGASEPDTWDYYMYEADDGYDLVEWISGRPWFDGFVGSFGAS